MDGSYPGVGEHRGCSTNSEPSKITDDDCEDKEKVTYVSRRFLILNTDWKVTVNTVDCNVVNAVRITLRDLLMHTKSAVWTVQDTVKNEVGQYHKICRILLLMKV